MPIETRDDLFPELALAEAAIREQLLRDAMYARYLDRQQDEIDMLRKADETIIPADFAYDRMSGLSGELKSKLAAAVPRTLSQASRIEGMTPAALALVLANIRKFKRLQDAG
jgi:tRNA uridine 5-carboxymethylaminomethyl modification enzyme